MTFEYVLEMKTTNACVISDLCKSFNMPSLTKRMKILQLSKMKNKKDL